MENLWTRLTPNEKKWLRRKYQDLTSDRDPYSPYDDWNDVDLLEELFGKDNLNSTQEDQEGIMIAPLSKVYSILRWARECTPDNEEAQISLNILESLFGDNLQDMRKCENHNKNGYSCFVEWPLRCCLETGEKDWCPKYIKKS